MAHCCYRACLRAASTVGVAAIAIDASKAPATSEQQEASFADQSSSAFTLSRSWSWGHPAAMTINAADSAYTLSCQGFARSSSA